MAELAFFPTAPGETVTAFALGPLEAAYFPGAVTRGVDRVDYKFINGFVDVGDLPCRIAMRQHVATRATPILSDFPTDALNLPGFNRRLDFSGFWHVPHRLSRWARTRLFPPQTGDAAFQIATCGGVHVWVDGAWVTTFQPYMRNEPRMQQIILPLRAEGSDLVLLVEDMAERDTDYFVELTWLGRGTLRAALQTEGDPGDIATLMALARDIRPDTIVFDGNGPLRLEIDTPAPKDVTVSALVAPSVHLSHQPPLFSARAGLAAGSTVIDLGPLDGLRDGYHPLKLRLAIGTMSVDRAIGFALLRQGTPTRLPGDLAARKDAALRHACTNGEPRMGRVLARLATGTPLDAAAFGALADTLDAINTRRDCSDFVLVPLLWAYGAYADAIPPDWRDRIRAAILGYRYWMDEPGNDTMWFWSENHVLCFHVSAYLAGGLFADQTFANSGLTGDALRAKATAQMTRWYDSVAEHGLAEWNSAAYYPIDFIGLFAMHHWGEGQMKTRATAILDQLFTMIALHNAGGVSAGTMGRAYDKELRAGPLTELSPFAAVAFGLGWLNDGVAALPSFCISDYVPPAGLERLAAPDDGSALTAHYLQGYGAAAHLALHKTGHVQLSAAIDAKPGAVGHQQHLVDVQMTAAPFARLWINHPGEDDPWGSHRPSFWAGNGIMPRVGMLRNCCLFLSDLGDDPRLSFTHAYAPLAAFNAVARGDDWMVLRSGHGAVIVKATGPITSVTTGPGAGLEHRVTGRLTGWALIAEDLDADAELSVLCQRAQAIRLHLGHGANNVPLLYLHDPEAPTLMLDYGAGLFVDGRHRAFPTRATQPQIETHRPSLAGRHPEETP